MQEVSEFRMPKSVLYGRNSLEKLGEQSKKLGKRAFIVTDTIMEKLGYVEKCIQQLNKKSITVSTYNKVDAEPTNIHVLEALSLCKEEKCDFIIGIGGGSCIDAAKAVAVLYTNGGEVEDYVQKDIEIENNPLPLIAIPTTSGTGSEVTSVAVITNKKTDVKMMMKHPSFIPKVAIIDPVLTSSLPTQITAATGIDALCHAIEAYISKVSQPLTDVLALSAIESIMKYLRIAYEDGRNMEAREAMMIASLQAGIAFSNASVTLVHGMSRPVGALFHVPHGISNAILLPTVLEFTKTSAMKRLAKIGRSLNKDLYSNSDEEVADYTLGEIKKLCFDLRIPNLKEYGIDEIEFENAISKMASDAIESGSPANNPRVPSYDEIKELYRECFNYKYKEFIKKSDY
ncbi:MULTISPECIES: iron-containing alcohol dehydrogenase [Bacillus]|uniref:Alcohol dehydrogenase EutG n=5 Tax=Bacillus thuringiensis TaxID=1428 RepID=A0AAP4QB63_BACTU|nr:MULTISPECIES: iron-containing alcohol dehydrogenase [Bacillus]AEA15823.1 1,3-propanediol dehydrogenase [Bacillus thuringiensis serovar chinensis CT-43]AFV17946.1 NADPH-dependent butanol dehydrogenase Adh [Bacillus thuringiensis Bt407]AGG00886.1 alcohol dehydrogenase, iron-containing [Bacillus thuringiensis serovar thuringiensis str. IS5056]AHA71602.1 alcohol dehydrogenase, iron-containing [Bacillus thuringiensis YBT-1518]ANC07599.1 alcohol dehydrogenase [Bacillus cereus]